MSKPIYTCLWFNGEAGAAAEFYCSVFPDSQITTDHPLVVRFKLRGTEFMGLNGGPQFTHSEAASLVVECKTQEEIDHYWSKLTEGGEESMCGWLKDKFGISWQIVPEILSELMSDPMRAPAVTQAILKMRKFNIAQLLEA